MKADAILRWTLNAPYRAEIRKSLHSHLKLSPTCYLEKDLTPSRISRDERDAQAVINIAKKCFYQSIFTKLSNQYIKWYGCKRCSMRRPFKRERERNQSYGGIYHIKSIWKFSGRIFFTNQKIKIKDVFYIEKDHCQQNENLDDTC